MLPEARVTREESSYRAKFFTGITSVAHKDFFCTSCGNTITSEADSYYSHPFLGTLQCQTCYDKFRHLKTSLDVEAWKKSCLMCGSNSCQTLFPCPVENCPYSFCRNCIKRNAQSALILADTKKWKCFVCMTNPLWEARGVCATLISASTRRMKKKQYGRNVSSDDDDIDDIVARVKSQKSLKQSKPLRQKISKIPSARETRSRSRASVNEEDSDDDIQIISTHERRTSKTSAVRTRRKISSQGSLNEESEISDCSVRKNKIFNTQPIKKKTGDSSTKNTSQKSLTVKRANSDSSSGKEFTQTKLIKESFVPLQRLPLEDANIVNERDEIDKSQKILSNQEASSLKDQMDDFIDMLKSTSERLAKAAESLQEQCPKEQKVKYREATKLLMHCKSTFSSFKRKMKKNERKMVSNFGNWCEKSNVKNIFPVIDITADSGADDSSAGSDCDDDKEILLCYTEKSVKNTEERTSKGALSPVHEEPSSSDGDDVKSALPKNSHNSSNFIKKNEEKNKTKRKEKNPNESLNDIFEEELDVEENQIDAADEETGHLSDSRPKFIEKQKATKKNSVRDKSPDHLELSGDESDTTIKRRSRETRSSESSIEFDFSRKKGLKRSRISDSSREDIEDQSGDDHQPNGRKDETCKQSKKKIRKECHSKIERAKKSEEEARKMLLDSSSDTENHSDQSIVEDTELPIKETDKKLIGCSKQAKKDQVADETSIRNAEEEAKKKLMNSDSSSTEDESNDPLGESQKEPSSNVAEEEAKQKLLNSSSSSNDEESSPVIDKIEKNATHENSKESNEDKTGESTDEIINKERLAKKKLLDSSSSEDENLKEKSEKPKSPSSLKSQAEVKRQQLESNKPKTAAGIGSEAVCSPGSFDAEKKAREMLLNSESSSEEESVINKTDESINPLKEAKKDGPAVTDSDEQAKQKLLNSSSSSVEDVETTPAVPNEAAHNSDVESTKKTRVTEAQEENSGPEKENRIVEAEKPCTEEESDVRKNINEKNLPSSKRERPIFLKKNRFYKADKKLRIPCWVTVARLPNTILRRHAKALKKSRDYLEDKSLNSLTCIDNLEKNRKRGHSEDHSDSSTVPSKSRNRKKTAKEPEEVLADHLNVNGDGQMEVDDDTSDSEACNAGLQEAQGLDKDNEEFAKRGLLDSSDDEKLEAVAESSGDDVENKTKKKKKKTKAESESDDEAEGKKSKSKKDDWRKDKLLRMKLSSSDEEENAGKFEKKVEKLSQNSKNSDDSDVEMGKKKDQMKKRTRRRRLNSDSDVKLTDVDSSESNASDSDKGEPKKSDKKTNKRRAKAVDDSSDSSSTVKSRAKPKRRRVRTAGTDSDSDEEMNNSQSSPNKPGRKNIRKVLKDKQVADDTKHAAKQEEERLKRMAERQKLYNEMYEARLAGEEKVDKLILDFDEETKEELLSVNEALVKRLKPHQAQGIKFMWDACFESLERATTTKGSGCILAHCMGLGKSFQVVTLTHTLLTNEKTGVKTVLVVCPLSTVLNWVNEFKIWLSEVEDGDDIEVYEMTKMKKNFERKYQLERWQKTGGVLIIGYEMYRNLSNPTKKLSKKIKESFFKCLVEPGPDLVVCDEGHLLKSESTAISKAMSKIRTLRRIVLTGTPLQNNLTEYHCMVQFVKPNLLGTKKEFLNRFVNPIQNGQFDDSTEYDVKIMKKRAHVLHKMLEGSVQRFDYSVLTPFLPPKQEYVIFLKLSDVQVKLYQYYIDNLARRHRAAGGSLFADFQALQRVWTHPLCIKLNADKVAERKLHEASDSEGSLRDFIDDDSDSDSSSKSDSSVVSTGSSKKSESAPEKRNTRANPNVNEEVVEEPAPGNTDWWAQFIEEDHYEDLRISAKLTILFDILKEAEQIGDKVLVFSQSLYSLTLIERFLALIDDETQRGITSDFIDGHTGSWSLGLDYFRLDGQSSTENRSQWCKIFNRPTNTRARLFLISTRAGGLGINLTAANRVVIFDASWNPSHDVQSIFRIYRFGQKKPCYVYRLLAAGTMEEKIYNRQVTKLSLSCRVVDEQQIERHYTNSDLAELYKFDKPDEESSKTIGCPKDRLLAEIFSRHKDLICNFHEHDSLLENKADEELDEEERKQAWLEYEQEKAGKPAYTYNPVQMMNMEPGQMMPNYQQMMNPFANGALMQSQLVDLQRLYQKDYPNLTPEQQKIMATKALMDMYSYMENRTIMDNRTILGNRLMMGKPQTNYGNPTNTLANQLAQEAYTKHHQQQKQMTAYQKQLAYAQQHGNFKTLAAGPVRGPQPNLIQQRPTASNDPDIIEITPTPATVTSNNAVAAQSSKAQPKPTNNQEE